MVGIIFCIVLGIVFLSIIANDYFSSIHRRNFELEKERILLESKKNAQSLSSAYIEGQLDAYKAVFEKLNIKVEVEEK